MCSCDNDEDNVEAWTALTRNWGTAMESWSDGGSPGGGPNLKVVFMRVRCGICRSGGFRPPGKLLTSFALPVSP